MKEGDIIEWKGVNKVMTGQVIKVANEFVCQLDNGKTFSLNDLRHSKSAKLIEK